MPTNDAIGISRDRLQLSTVRMLSYFLLPGLLIVAAGSTIFFAVMRGNGLQMLWVPTIFVLAAILLVWQLRRGLRFHTVQTGREPADNMERVLDVARKREWQRAAAEPEGTMEFHTPRSMFSWGEMVTVRFEGGAVLINSISDPGHGPSITSMGGNARNVRLVASALRGDAG